MKIRAERLTRVFESGRLGLRDVDFSLENPCFVLITGPNGSGKTLLARHLLGLEKASSGDIHIDGKPLFSDLKELRRRLTYIFQEPEHQILGLSVEEDLCFTPKQFGYPKAKTEALLGASLEAVGLRGKEKELTSVLSGGEKRRLAIASCLMTEPEFLLLDEPFNDLDHEGVSELLVLLLKLREKGIGILLISHDLEKCLAHADRLMVFRSGSLIADDSPEVLWPRFKELGLRIHGSGNRDWKDCTWLEGAPHE